MVSERFGPDPRKISKLGTRPGPRKISKSRTGPGSTTVPGPDGLWIPDGNRIPTLYSTPNIVFIVSNITVRLKC